MLKKALAIVFLPILRFLFSIDKKKRKASRTEQSFFLTFYSRFPNYFLKNKTRKEKLKKGKEVLFYIKEPL